MINDLHLESKGDSGNFGEFKGPPLMVCCLYKILKIFRFAHNCCTKYSWCCKENMETLKLLTNLMMETENYPKTIRIFLILFLHAHKLSKKVVKNEKEGQNS